MTTGPDGDAAEEVAGAVAAAVRRLRRRSPAWWRAAAPGVPGTSRADHVAALVAALAVAGREAEGLPGPHPVPARPEREEVLADQLAVVGRDLAAAVANDTTRATAALDAIERCLAAVDPRGA